MDPERFEIKKTFVRDIMLRMAETPVCYEEAVEILAMCLANVVMTVKLHSGVEESKALVDVFGDTMADCIEQIGDGEGVDREVFGPSDE